MVYYSVKVVTYNKFLFVDYLVRIATYHHLLLFSTKYNLLPVHLFIIQ